MTLRRESSPSFFDVPYGIPSGRLTATAAALIVASTGADYWGYAIQVSSAAVTLIVFNNSGTASGGVLDVITVSTSTAVRHLAPTKAKNGITVSCTGTNGVATIFYTPKG